MKIHSFVRDGLELKPIEVEVSLLPGLPNFEVLGQADPAIKESLGRVRSALKASKYQLPQRERVLFNLKPAYEKKQSEGLDLAFAIGYLLASEQLKLHFSDDQPLFIYGELGLEGAVTASSELELLSSRLREGILLTGRGAHLEFEHYAIQNLHDIETLEEVSPGAPVPVPARPELPNWSFDKNAARILEVVASGEHSVLLAGPAGSGKSTWAQALPPILRDLDPLEAQEVRRISKVLGREPEWRPYVSPHHSIPMISLIGGGGSPIFPGEITRAHKGVLFLDEFLEFSSAAKEAFREPMETGFIHVARKGKNYRFPADAVVVAATNLCVCGSWVPNYRGSCTRSLTQCSAYLKKLSGPLLDRFDILALTHTWQGEKSVRLIDILENVQRAQERAREWRGARFLASQLSVAEILQETDSAAWGLYSGDGRSLRRERSLLRVARSLADLDGAQVVGLRHLEEAFQITWKSFRALEQGHN